MKWFRRWFQKKKEVLESPKEETGKENPYLPKLRFLLEQILEQYQMSYREFSPLLIDSDTPPESMLQEDDVSLVLEQISRDLNFLKIATDRPVYFSSYIERMYEDTGLVVQIEAKKNISLEQVNVVLDLEQQGGLPGSCIKEGICYIPIYKKPWNPAENLDISVPIGYNTVIVKGI